MRAIQRPRLAGLPPYETRCASAVAFAAELELIDAQTAIVDYCAHESLGSSSAKQYANFRDGMDDLIRLYRDDPEAVFESGTDLGDRTMRQVLVDQASDLEECDPSAASELDRVLDE